MTMFQCVRLSISSSVIMFHRERKECGPENGKNGGRSRNNAPKPESGKKGEAYGQPQPIEEKRQGRHGKRRQTARTARKRQRKNCNMQSWERAQPLSPFEVSPDGTGRRFYLENSGWRDPLGYHNAAKYPPADFFIDLVLCVVGRFACQVPNHSATRTAIPERFFGRKITAGNFMSRKPKAWTCRYSPSELPSWWDLVREATLISPAIAIGEIWYFSHFFPIE